MAASRKLQNVEDIIQLFSEGYEAVINFLTSQGLSIEEMHCDKCFDAEIEIKCLSLQTIDSVIRLKLREK